MGRVVDIRTAELAAKLDRLRYDLDPLVDRRWLELSDSDLIHALLDDALDRVRRAVVPLIMARGRAPAVRNGGARG